MTGSLYDPKFQTPYHPKPQTMRPTLRSVGIESRPLADSDDTGEVGMLSFLRVAVRELILRVYGLGDLE